MSDSQELGLGPRLLAIETALRALIDQAGASDPTLRDRIRQAADLYLASVPQRTELEREFVKRSHHCLDSLVRPPDL